MEQEPSPSSWSKKGKICQVDAGVAHDAWGQAVQDARHENRKGKLSGTKADSLPVSFLSLPLAPLPDNWGALLLCLCANPHDCPRRLYPWRAPHQLIAEADTACSTSRRHNMVGPNPPSGLIPPGHMHPQSDHLELRRATAGRVWGVGGTDRAEAQFSLPLSVCRLCPLATIWCFPCGCQQLHTSEKERFVCLQPEESQRRFLPSPV